MHLCPCCVTLNVLLNLPKSRFCDLLGGDNHPPFKGYFKDYFKDQLASPRQLRDQSNQIWKVHACCSRVMSLVCPEHKPPKRFGAMLCHDSEEI